MKCGPSNLPCLLIEPGYRQAGNDKSPVSLFDCGGELKVEIREIIRNTLKLILSLDVNTNLINFIGNGMVGSGFLTEIRIETLNRPETSVHQHHQHQQHNRLNMLTLWLSGQQRVGRLGEVRTGRVCCHSRVARVTN